MRWRFIYTRSIFGSSFFTRNNSKKQKEYSSLIFCFLIKQKNKLQINSSSICILLNRQYILITPARHGTVFKKIVSNVELLFYRSYIYREYFSTTIFYSSLAFTKIE